MTDAKSLTERLSDASVEARDTLRDLHVAAKDLRSVLRECEQMKRDLKNLLDDITEKFREKAEAALAESLPLVADGVEKTIDKYNGALQKSTTGLLEEVSGKIERERKITQAMVDQVRDDLRRTMDVSKDARDQSAEVRKTAEKIARLLESLQEEAQKEGILGIEIWELGT